MMDHPNIARVLDGGLMPGGQPFFVMELVNGLPLTKFCDEARLTPRERLELFVPVCQAVQHAHQKGVVHRDLKPANILVTLIDGKAITKVIDFGVAKATGDKRTDHSMSTQFGAVVGTLEYMSPEQAGFSAVDIDTRADIYSLGVVLYELLTGLRPINARRLKQAGLAEMIRIIVEARPPSPGYRLSKFLRRHRGAVIAAALVLVALLAGIAGTTFGLIRAERRRIEAMKQRDIADKASVEAVAQKKIADDQKQLAVANASKADENAMKAELRLAEGLLSQADAWSLAGRFGGAHSLYTEAYDKFAQLKAPLLAAEAGLCNSYRQTGTPLLSFAGHTREVRSVAFSPDGRTALSGSVDKTLRLWELATGRELRIFIGHSKGVNRVAIAPDGQTALSGSEDNMLKLWDLANGRELRTFTGHSGEVLGVAIAPDGRTALSAGRDATLKLWDLPTGKELRTLSGNPGAVSSVAITPDGRSAVSGIWGSTPKLWDMASGKEVRIFTGDAGILQSLAISPDGRTILSGGHDETKLWDLTSGKELRSFTVRSRGFQYVAISPDGRTALSGGWKASLNLWDLAGGKELRTFTGHSGEILSVAISPDGRTALSGATDRTLKLWQLSGEKELRTFTRQSAPVTGLIISPDGRTALSESFDRTLRL